MEDRRHRRGMSGGTVAFLVVLAAFVVLDLVAWRWGADTRTGRDWQWGEDRT